MPGRDDFAIIRGRLFADERAHRAAELYVEAGIAVDATALATVVGHISMLGIWASRETDQGVLPGDGVTVMSVATFSPRGVATTSCRCLLDAGLLRAVEGGVYLVGFAECYAALTRKRERDRQYAANSRAAKSADGEPETPSVAPTSRRRRADVAPTSSLSRDDVVTESGRSRVAPDRTGPYRTEESPPTPLAGGSNDGGGSTSSPEPQNGNGTAAPLSPDDLVIATEIARKLRGEASARERKAGEAVWALIAAGQPDPDAMRAFIDRWQHQPNVVGVVEKHRKILRMTANGRARDEERAARAGRRLP